MIAKKLHWLMVGVFLLALANIINDIAGRPFYSITKLIYFSWEGNISTWYSSMIFAVGAYLAYQCYLKAKSAKVIHYYAFLLFSVLLVTMSCDEVAQMHEMFGAALGKHIFGVDVEQGVGIAVSTAWAWGGGLVVIAVFAVCLMYVFKPLVIVPAAAKLLPLGLFCIIFGGIVLEASTNFISHEKYQWVFDLEVIVEETMEMIGAMLIVYAHASWLDSFNEEAYHEYHVEKQQAHSQPAYVVTDHEDYLSDDHPSYQI